MSETEKATEERPQNQTLYIRNIDETVKIPVLKESLEIVFSQYGNVLDVVAHPNLKMRGQAFVVFDDSKAAQSAKDEVQGFPLFEKPIEIQYARSRSDAIVKKEGDEVLEEHKKRRLAEKERKKAEALAASKSKKRSAGAASGRPTKRQMIADENLPPNKIMFLQNLPGEITSEELTEVFDKYPGFFEVRLVPGRKGIAFVEYETDENAIAAKEGESELQFDGQKVKITYARK